MGPHPGAAGLSLSPEGWSAEGAWAPEALSPLEGKEARKWLENISRRLDLGLPVCGGGGGGGRGGTTPSGDSQALALPSPPHPTSAD